MAVETASYISQLNTSWPQAVDLLSEGDDHIRQIKTVLKTQFPNFGTAAINASVVEVNYLVGVTSSIQTQINSKSNTASPTFTGTVVLPSSTSIGTVSSTELGYLDGVTSSIQTQINGRGAIAGQTWTGGHNYTGATITVPTATAGDSSSSAASTAFVAGVAFSTALPAQSGNAGKFVTTDGTTASWSSNLFYTAGNFGIGRSPVYALDVYKPGTSLHAIAATNDSVVSALMVAENRGQVGTLTNHLFYILSGGVTRLTLDTVGNFLNISPAGSIGYGVGAGGTVTQATSITTAVTLNKPTGRITTQTYSGGTVSFRLNNSLIAATDTVVATINPSNPGNFPDVTKFWVGNVNAGYCDFSLSCIQTGITFTINFSIIKGAIS